MQYKTLKDHVYDYLSKSIQEGTIKAGDKINELDISGELNISRTPVREALIELSATGLLTSEPRKGFCVRPLDGHTAQNLYHVIGALDALAAELSINNLTEDDHNKMEGIIKDMEKAIKAKDYDLYYTLQVEFHDVYTNKTGNDELIYILSMLKKRFIKQAYPHSDKVGADLSVSNQQHRIILDLIKEKDAKALSEYLKETHWDIEYSGLDAL